MDESPPVNRNVFAVLFALAILLLVFATTFLLVHGATRLGVIPVDFLAYGFVFPFIVQLVALGIAIYAGLYLGKSIGVGAPLLESWAKGEPVKDRAVSALKISLAIGLGVTAMKYLLDLLVFSPFLPATISQLRGVPVEFLFSIPFQQGIGDEIIYRLFWMTVIVWVIWKIRGSENAPRAWMYWMGILLAGLILVAGLIISGTRGLVVLQYAVLILAGAIPFGWLYWKRGIESALVAHFVSSVALTLLALA
ncbi:MAG TPA: hypothetical protein VEI51_02625 [Methanomicrobiales archaeon]|nr:hypothetical protein [Methanomicrobiales archaeon]